MRRDLSARVASPRNGARCRMARRAGPVSVGHSVCPGCAGGALAAGAGDLAARAAGDRVRHRLGVDRSRRAAGTPRAGGRCAGTGHAGPQ